MKIIILRTKEEKAKGLQGVKHLSPNTFLIFKDMGPGSVFHTKNCYINIDIIPVDAQGRILSIITAKPNQINIGPMPLGTKHVIETKGGWAKKNKINTGKNLLYLFG
jgi:uncharacterized membrane protein (UPF0127 family)